MRPDVGLDYWQFAPHLDVIAWAVIPRGTAATTRDRHHDRVLPRPARSFKQGQPSC